MGDLLLGDHLAGDFIEDEIWFVCLWGSRGIGCLSSSGSFWLLVSFSHFIQVVSGL